MLLGFFWYDNKSKMFTLLSLFLQFIEWHYFSYYGGIIESGTLDIYTTQWYRFRETSTVIESLECYPSNKTK